ncbi:hypothetical protein BDC45DRAFT_540881 [Circinella umbellata]|nr:hypothetical protein BDC45DRAFT_540881 [Circinella umbellata]
MAKFNFHHCINIIELVSDRSGTVPPDFFSSLTSALCSFECIERSIYPFEFSRRIGDFSSSQYQAGLCKGCSSDHGDATLFVLRALSSSLLAYAFGVSRYWQVCARDTAGSYYVSWGVPSGHGDLTLFVLHALSSSSVANDRCKRQQDYSKFVAFHYRIGSPLCSCVNVNFGIRW